MRLRVAASTAMPAAMAVSRALRITPREALVLLRAPRVLPADLSEEAASTLAAALSTLGVSSEVLNVPSSGGRCEQHPGLTNDEHCEQCRRSVCPLCQPWCSSCRASLARASRWKRVRVAVLLLVLFGVGGFALWKQRARDVRHSWVRPLQVSVVLVSTKPVGAAELTAWNDGAGRLQRWFSDEATRFALHLEAPVRISIAPRVVEADAPSPPSANGEWLDDSRAAIDFRNQLDALAERGGGAGNVRVVMALRERGAHRVDGVGEAGGSIGLVEGTQGDLKLTLELLAVAHEVLHLLGAHDGYDENGHALPRGLVDPERGFPQRFAEVMVGEVPLSANDGRVPDSLDEVRIGEVTAKEIGWK